MNKRTRLLLLLGLPGCLAAVALAFILDTMGFLGTMVWTIASRPYWQVVSAAMLGGTVAGYAFYLAKGWETADRSRSRAGPSR